MEKDGMEKNMILNLVNYYLKDSILMEKDGMELHMISKVI